MSPKHPPQTHQMFMVGLPPTGTCPACGAIRKLEFRDGDTNEFICRDCYEDVAFANIMLQRMERNSKCN